MNMDSPNDKMVRPSETERKTRTRSSKPEATRNGTTWNFPTLGKTVEADTYEEALQKVNEVQE